jgi:RNA polymerase sigma-70 factor (ECF subfamily)
VPAPGAADDLAKRFLDACTTGDVDDLLSMLADDAMAWADGGGKFSAARRPIAGADKVARFIASVVQKWRTSGDVRVAPVSGGIGLLLHAGGVLRAVMTVETGEGRVRGVFVVVNPDKLTTQSTPFA